MLNIFVYKNRREAELAKFELQAQGISKLITAAVYVQGHEYADKSGEVWTLCRVVKGGKLYQKANGGFEESEHGETPSGEAAGGKPAA